MSLISAHLPCPKCSSSDAYAEYEDNFYCFSCKVHFQKNLRKKRPQAPRATISDTLCLPPDVTSELPRWARAWLYKHHFTDSLIEKANIQYSEDCEVWSPSNQMHFFAGSRIIFPYYEKGELLFYEARTLDPRNKLKYITLGGKKDIYKTFTGSAKKIVIVEDVASAIRVGEIMPAVALRGTSANNVKLHQIMTAGESYVIWLDNDRAGKDAAKNLMHRLSWGGSVSRVKSEKDPKCYSLIDIEKKLKNLTEEKDLINYGTNNKYDLLEKS